MYNDTITLFNRKESRTGDTWYPTVIHNVDLNMDKAAAVEKYGPESKDRALLHVRYAQNGKEKIIAGKLWKPPKEWEKLEGKDKSITFTDGDRFDFFWFGDWGSEDPVQDIDYAADTDFYTYMNRTHDYVFAISSVGGPYTVIPHFEITGK